MSVVLIKAGQLLLSLSILIVLHEFGHFIAAKIFKTRVEKFYLFFNPWFSIFKFRKGETEYGLGWLPLGGYVKISGMVDESMDTEQMKMPPQPWEFRSKPAWQRMIIMLAGIIMNVLLAIVIYWMLLFLNGEQYLSTTDLKYGISVDSTGEQLGLKNGDQILNIDGRTIQNFATIPASIVTADEITVARNGSIEKLPVSKAAIKSVIGSKEFISVRIPFVVDSVVSGTPAEQAGLQHNDVLLTINNQPALFYNDGKNLLINKGGQLIHLAVLRNHRVVHTSLTLRDDGTMGFFSMNPDRFFPVQTVHYSFLGALPAGVSKAYQTIANYAKQLVVILSPQVGGYKYLGGFITIANVFQPHWDWTLFWGFTGFLSLILAFFNLLPIPALDGGHVLFTLIEMVTRRRPSDKFLEYAQVVGMCILLLLVLYANGNDVVRLFHH